MIIATAGHVDHGKTSLVNALTGVDTDRLEEEKKRGLTIDLGFAYTNTESGERLGFVDVPGHIRFINNMLAGVSAIDFALLVIAADDGVMPQTREHLDILDLLGIPEGIIALTKTDRCDEAQIAATIDGINEAVTGTFLEGADIYPVSSTTGEGIDTLQLALDIAATDRQQRSDAGQFRLAIDRRFSVKGAGMVVTGSVFSGGVSIGDEILLMPQNVPVRVRGLHTQNEETTSAVAGDRCAVNITSNQLELDDISRGNWLTTNRSKPSNRVDIRLQVLRSELRPLTHWTPVHIHTAANHVSGRIALLAPTRLAPGETGLAQLVFEPPINVCVGDRIVIRDQAALRTIGGGTVISPYSPKRGRARPQRLETLALIDPVRADESIYALLEHAATGIASDELTQTFNLSDAHAAGLFDYPDLLHPGADTPNAPGALLIHQDRFQQCLQTLGELLDQWHEKNPGKAGLPHNQIKALVRTWPDVLVSQLIDQLLANAELERNGNLLKRPGHGVQLDQKEMKVWEAVLPLLQADLIKPPVLHDLAASVGEDPKQLEKILKQVIKTGQLVRPVKNRFFLVEAIDELKQWLHQVAAETGSFTVQDYRDATGIGRNLCIELLEYFDRQGITRRVGDARSLTEKT